MTVKWSSSSGAPFQLRLRIDLPERIIDQRHRVVARTVADRAERSFLNRVLDARRRRMVDERLPELSDSAASSSANPERHRLIS